MGFEGACCLKVKELPLFKPQVVKSQEVAPSNLHYLNVRFQLLSLPFERPG